MVGRIIPSGSYAVQTPVVDSLVIGVGVAVSTSDSKKGMLIIMQNPDWFGRRGLMKVQ